MCADCILKNCPYAVIIDKAVRLPRCARCGRHSTIYWFLWQMDNTYRERYGGQQEAEQEAVKEGAKLFGGSKGAKMTKTEREDRIAQLASAGVGLFHIEDHMNVSTIPEIPEFAAQNQTCTSM